jgi:hypothetical protein
LEQATAPLLKGGGQSIDRKMESDWQLGSLVHRQLTDNSEFGVTLFSFL